MKFLRDIIEEKRQARVQTENPEPDTLQAERAETFKQALADETPYEMNSDEMDFDLKRLGRELHYDDDDGWVGGTADMPEAAEPNTAASSGLQKMFDGPPERAAEPAETPLNLGVFELDEPKAAITSTALPGLSGSKPPVPGAVEALEAAVSELETLRLDAGQAETGTEVAGEQEFVSAGRDAEPLPEETQDVQATPSQINEMQSHPAHVSDEETETFVKTALAHNTAMVEATVIQDTAFEAPVAEEGPEVADAVADHGTRVEQVGGFADPVFEPDDAKVAPAIPTPPVKETPVAETVQQSELVQSAAAEFVTPIAVPSPAAGRGMGRSGRVKTRILGFSAPSSTSDDPFEKAGSKTKESASTSFPVGWIVVVNGPGRGTAFTIFDGVTQIGRGEDQAVPLDFGDNSISRENHAAIAYDAEQGAFFIGHGGKANLVRVNGRPVLSTEELNTDDEVRIGETTLRFIGFCGQSFSWEQDRDVKHARI